MILIFLSSLAALAAFLSDLSGSMLLVLDVKTLARFWQQGSGFLTAEIAKKIREGRNENQTKRTN
jgi:hypothetical protein